MKNNLIRFLELIKMKGELEFLGSCELDINPKKINTSFCYKNILKVFCEAQYDFENTGKFYPIDIKELIKTIKNFKKDFKIKLDKEDLICYNSTNEIKISGINEKLNLNKKAIMDDNLDYITEFKKSDLKRITDLHSITECKEILINKNENKLTITGKGNNTEKKEIFEVDNKENINLKLSSDFFDLLKTVNDSCNICFKNDRVLINYETDDIICNYVLMGLENNDE